MALNVFNIQSLSCPQVEPARAFSIPFLLDTLFIISLQWKEKLKPVSNDTPRIFGIFDNGNNWLFMKTYGYILCWELSGVNKVTVDLLVEIGNPRF